ATYLDGEHFDPSPYAPVSRLFWNELYVDPRGTEEFARCGAARELVDRGDPPAEVDGYVDFPRVYAAKRRVLDLLAETFFASGAGARLERYVRSHPQAEEYARFRAKTEGPGGYETHLYA